MAREKIAGQQARRRQENIHEEDEKRKSRRLCRSGEPLRTRDLVNETRIEISDDKPVGSLARAGSL